MRCGDGKRSPTCVTREFNSRFDLDTGIRYHAECAKAASNLRRHGVDFQDAIVALEDPNRIEEADDRFDYEEDRDIVIGMASGGVLFVIATYRNESTRRIIAARKATKHEEDRYHAGDREIW